MTTTAISSSRGRAWMIFTIVSALLMTCFAMLVLTDIPKYKSAVEKEAMQTSLWLDAEAANKINDKVNDRQRKWIYESGFYPTIRDALKPKHVQYIEDTSKGVFSTRWIERILMNGQYLAYQFIHRVTMLEFWLWSLSPLMAAIVITGVFKWRIKQYQLGGQSVNMTRLWIKVFWVLGAALSAYLFSPSIVGVISIYVPAVFLVLTAFATAQVIQSYNKYI